MADPNPTQTDDSTLSADFLLSQINLFSEIQMENSRADYWGTVFPHNCCLFGVRLWLSTGQQMMCKESWIEFSVSYYNISNITQK